MASQELTRALYDLFSQIAEGELDIEAIRQVLYEQEGFNAESLFKYMDFMSKGFITSDDIFKLMQDYSEFTPMSSYLLLKEWDIKNKGHLFYEDFIKWILPSTCQSPITNPGAFSNSQFALKRLLRSELSLLLKLESIKQHIWGLKHFSPSYCFNLIDSSGTGYIKPSNLQKFLRLNHMNTSSFIEAIFKRLDRDCDGNISYTEFINVVTPANKVYGSEENFTSIFTEPGRTPEIFTQQSEFQYKIKRKTTGKTNSVKKFARFLMQQIMLEKELEEKRKRLALRLDFSVGKLFSMISKGCEKINVSEFERSLRELGILPELNQCHLLFRQYDRDNDNCLSFEDFCEIFNPRTSEYSELLMSRFITKEQKEEFSIETIDMIVDTFIVILNIQTVTEELKLKLYAGKFNVQKIFERIDMNRLGFLTKGCFRNLLRKFKYYATEKDLEAILIVYDGNKDYKISYSKFVQGLCPKSVNKS